jgi:hypothetical protein
MYLKTRTTIPSWFGGASILKRFILQDGSLLGTTEKSMNRCDQFTFFHMLLTCSNIHLVNKFSSRKEQWFIDNVVASSSSLLVIFLISKLERCSLERTYNYHQVSGSK